MNYAERLYYIEKHESGQFRNCIDKNAGNKGAVPEKGHDGPTAEGIKAIKYHE